MDILQSTDLLTRKMASCINVQFFSKSGYKILTLLTMITEYENSSRQEEYVKKRFLLSVICRDVQPSRLLEIVICQQSGKLIFSL